MRIELSQQAQARLGQQIKLAPRVLQSMEILQLPIEGLEERIDQELESNVALETAESLGEPSPPADAAHAKPSEHVQDAYARAQAMHDRSGDDFAERSRERARLSGEPDTKSVMLANIPTRGQSLEGALLAQWALCEAPEPIMEAGREILRWITPAGLLAKSLDEIAREVAQQRRENAPSPQLFVAALARLQQHLEPVGLAARDLRECLLLQLDAAKLASRDSGTGTDTRLADARVLVEAHLPDLEAGRFAHIERANEWSSKRLDAAREVLRHLNPAPGRALNVEAEPPVRPDVIIDYDPTTEVYSARLASGLIPNLRVSEEYMRMARSDKVDAATRTLLTDGVRRARWFIDAVEQRGATLLRVVNEIIARQREWLDVGAEALKPLPMTRVARELGMNVSTVSRTVAGKWVATPRGAFALRTLFSGGTETDSGSDISWRAVKAMVRDIIAAEPKAAPLSDQAIARALKERGVTLARRTVVKYLEQLGIPISRLLKVRPVD